MSENGNILNRTMNLGALRKTITVEVAELGCSVILRQLSVAQLASLSSDLTQQLALTIVDEQGQRIYTTAEDIQALSEMSATAASLLIEQATALNGVSKEAVDQALKNSVASLSSVSVTA